MNRYPKCNLCKATGNNITGMVMRVNNEICPRCGGYAYVPEGCANPTDNPSHVTESDKEYARANGWDGKESKA